MLCGGVDDIACRKLTGERVFGAIDHGPLLDLKNHSMKYVIQHEKVKLHVRHTIIYQT